MQFLGRQFSKETQEPKKIHRFHPQMKAHPGKQVKSYSTSCANIILQMHIHYSWWVDNNELGGITTETFKILLAKHACNLKRRKWIVLCMYSLISKYNTFTRFHRRKKININERPSIIFAFYRHNCRIALLLKFKINLLLGSRCYWLSKLIRLWAMSSLLSLEDEGKQLFNLCQPEVLSSHMLQQYHLMIKTIWKIEWIESVKIWYKLITNILYFLYFFGACTGTIFFKW